MRGIEPHRHRGVFTDGKSIFTENLVPGESVYGEKLARQRNTEYRRWDPMRSKLGALVQKGTANFPIGETSKILYLGAASGTTASHVSDIARGGVIYCVEVSKIPFQKLLLLARKRKNIIPIMADASFPERYARIVPDVDLVYQDIAQRDQVWIFVKNLGFLRSGGHGIMMIKARSIDVAKEPRDIYSQVEKDFRDRGLQVMETKELAPFEKDHAAIILRKT